MSEDSGGFKSTGRENNTGRAHLAENKESKTRLHISFNASNGRKRNNEHIRGIGTLLQ